MSEVLGLVHVVRGEHDRLAQGGELLDDIPGLVPGGRVEPGGGLVEEQQVGIASQGDGHVEPALLATGELIHPIIALVGQPDDLDDLVHRPGMRIEPGVHGNRLVDCEVRLDPRRLQDDPDARLELHSFAGRVRAQNLDFSVVT